MTEKKFKNIVVAVTAGAVMLLIILLSVLVYQLIAIRVGYKDLAELETQIEIYKENIGQSEDIIKERNTYQWIVMRARQLGYYFDGDKLYRINEGE